MWMMAAAVAAATAGGLEDLGALDEAIAVAAQSMGATALPVDRRLRLARCPQGVQIDAVDARSIGVRCPTLGWRLRVPLVAATAFAKPTAPIVRRGDPLTVVSGGNGFRVETSAVAVEDGALGTSVRARLDGGNRQVWGIVSAAGEISVGRP